MPAFNIQSSPDATKATSSSIDHIPIADDNCNQTSEQTQTTMAKLIPVTYSSIQETELSSLTVALVFPIVVIWRRLMRSRRATKPLTQDFNDNAV
jgi:hypothetical protein